MNYNFQWDVKKEKQNRLKHKVDFELASSVFKDPNAISIFDNAHSKLEERWITVGISKNGNLLVVSHTFKEIDKENFQIRIISARKATKKEEKQY